MKSLIPINKFDTQFIERLRDKDINEIRPIVPNLLEWMQDGNWPTSEFIIEYFLPQINEIDNEIITILRGNDEMWKYWILLCLIYGSPNRPNDKILSAVKFLRDNPTEMEKEADVEQIAIEIMEKFESPR